MSNIIKQHSSLPELSEIERFGRIVARLEASYKDTDARSIEEPAAYEVFERNVLPYAAAFVKKVLATDSALRSTLAASERMTTEHRAAHQAGLAEIAAHPGSMDGPADFELAGLSPLGRAVIPSAQTMAIVAKAGAARYPNWKNNDFDSASLNGFTKGCLATLRALSAPAPAATSISGGAGAEPAAWQEWFKNPAVRAAAEEEVFMELSLSGAAHEQAIGVWVHAYALGHAAALSAAPASVTSPVEPAGKVSGQELAAAMRWLWPVMDHLMEGRLQDWSDEDLLTAHCCDFVRDKALTMLYAVNKGRAALTSSLGGAETGGWVPVGERLPALLPGSDYSPRVLAFGDGGIDGPHFVAYYGKSYGWYLAHDNQPNMKVTHWQQLPSAPTPA